MSLPIVTLVGRPNVGESAVFSRIINSRVAIVEDKTGITRDRIYAHAGWMGHEFILINIGGITLDSGEVEEQIKTQAGTAIDKANVIVMLEDVTQHMTNMDETIAKTPYRTKKPIILAVSRTDDPGQRIDIYDFYSLGLGNPIPISGSHGTRMGDLPDAIVGKFGNRANQHEDDSIRFNVVGCPNIGESSLVNAILGEQRVIVSNTEETTRDTIDTTFTNDGQKYTIVDTAGIRHRSEVYERIEKYSVLRAAGTIEESDITLLILDASTGIREQDRHAAGYVHDAGRGVIIVVNKWDLPKKDSTSMKDFEDTVGQELQYLDYAPIVFVSAKTGQGIPDILKLVKEVHDNQTRRIKSSVLNDLLLETTRITSTPLVSGKRLRIYCTAQVAVVPPTLVVFVNDLELLYFSCRRFLINQLRQNFGFVGTPVRILARKRK